MSLAQHLASAFYGYLSKAGVAVTMEQCAAAAGTVLNASYPSTSSLLPATKAPSKPRAKKEAVETGEGSCSYEFERGGNAGQTCGKSVIAGYDYCRACITKAKVYKKLGITQEEAKSISEAAKGESKGKGRTSSKSSTASSKAPITGLGGSLSLLPSTPLSSESPKITLGKTPLKDSNGQALYVFKGGSQGDGLLVTLSENNTKQTIRGRAYENNTVLGPLLPTDMAYISSQQFTVDIDSSAANYKPTATATQTSNSLALPSMPSSLTSAPSLPSPASLPSLSGLPLLPSLQPQPSN